ncbi:MAG: winged helix-turn-helix transcriptional regulator [Armatimonadetes bacterium]|nr:winged helix-turn-helix transcriptional regulator [Armatimonadota bacterium]
MNTENDFRKQAEEGISALTESGRDVVGHFGAVEVEGKRRQWWSIRYDGAVTKLLNNPDYKVAQILSVLGSEVRLAILRHLLQGPKVAAEIVAEVGLKTTGQAYHHLRELERAGYIKQKAGGRYHFDMNGGRVYLAALALAADAGAEEPEDIPEGDGE